MVDTCMYMVDDYMVDVHGLVMVLYPCEWIKLVDDGISVIE
jgi:hypothetical protein